MRGSNEGTEGNEQPFVLAEINLEILPIFKVTGRVKETTPYTLEWSGHTQDGSRIEKSWTVEPHSQYGAPRGRDQDVFIAVLTLMESRDGMPQDGVVSTTRAELLQILGWPNNGKHYQQVRDCLMRIDRTIIASRDAFYHRDTETWLDGSFRIWTVEFLKSRRRKDGRNEEIVTIRFDDVLIRSFLAAYLKGLDTNLYWSLSSHLAKRLYRLIDRMRGNRLEWDENLFKLQDRIPIGPYRYPSKIREKLESSHAELMEKGFLTDVGVDEAGRVVQYRVAAEFARRRETFERADSPEGLLAMEMMATVGMPVSESQRLVAEYGPERCLACAQALPFQRNIRKSSLAWLRWAVKDHDFDPYPYLRGEKGDIIQGVVEEAPSTSPAESTAQNEIQRNPQPQLVDEGSVERSPQDMTSESAVGGSQQREHTPDSDPEAQEIWEKVLKDVSDEVNAPSLRVWFEGTIPVSLTSDTLTISVPNNFAKDYIESRFKELLEGALLNHPSPTSSLQIVVGAEGYTNNTSK